MIAIRIIFVWKKRTGEKKKRARCQLICWFCFLFSVHIDRYYLYFVRSLYFVIYLTIERVGRLETTWTLNIQVRIALCMV